MKARFGWGWAIAAATLCWMPPAVAAPYARAPMADYQMARDDEIAMARSSAPPAISKDATVLVLGANGYDVAAKGSNGFTCLVERSWATMFDDPEYWNAKIRAPNCYNAAATRSVLSEYLTRTEWVLAGADVATAKARTIAAVKAGTIRAPEVGSMCYMMSKAGYLSDKAGGHWHPHLMYFLPRTDAAKWGANMPGSPMLAFVSKIEPQTVFFAPVPAWSDGTMGPMETHGQ
jgi:hypothetical protein